MQPDPANQTFVESIYHEQQSGALCAVHAVNAIMQKREWNEFQFAEIARSLDNDELSAVATGGDTSDIRRFTQQKSVNYDDSGYFSVQVVMRALEINGVQCAYLLSPDHAAIRANPVNEQAFLCHHADHWLTMRRFGSGGPSPVWFNLNSTFRYPEFVSDTYLSLFIEQLISEDYAVFIIRGNLPTCRADGLTNMFNRRSYVRPITQVAKAVDYTQIADPRERDELQRALELSKQELDRPLRGHGGRGGSGGFGGGFDDDLARALALSRQEFESGGGRGRGGVGGGGGRDSDGDWRMTDVMQAQPGGIFGSQVGGGGGGGGVAFGSGGTGVAFGSGGGGFGSPMDDDLARAIQLSLMESQGVGGGAQQPVAPSPNLDDDIMVEEGADEDNEMMVDVPDSVPIPSDPSVPILMPTPVQTSGLHSMSKQALQQRYAVESEGGVQVRFRFSDGDVLDRKFGDGSIVEDLFGFAMAFGPIEGVPEALTISFPKKSFLLAEHGAMTLSEAGLGGRVQLFVS